MSEKRIPVPLRAREFGGAAPRWMGWATFAVLLALWEMAVRAGWISRTFIASPAEIIVQLQNLLLSGELWLHLGASLRRLLIGWGLGSAVGIVIGLMIGLWRVARGTLLPLVFALLPLFLVWFGIDEGSKVATILIGTLFPTVIATYAAVDNVDRNLIRMGQSFGLPPAAIVRKIILPGAMPGIFAGFRISISIAITMLVVAEMMNAERGVGAYIAAAGQLYQMDQLLAGVTLLALLGIVLSWLLGVCERRVLCWREKRDFSPHRGKFYRRHIYDTLHALPSNRPARSRVGAGRTAGGAAAGAGRHADARKSAGKSQTAAGCGESPPRGGDRAARAGR